MQTFALILILLINQVFTLNSNIKEVEDAPVSKPVYSINFDKFDELQNHNNNCSLAMSKYFMLVGCEDGWTAM